MRNIKPKRILVRITAIFIMCFVVMLALGALVLNNVLIKRVEQLENINMIDDLSSIEKAVDNKIEYLSTLTTDWAAWDDSYQFVQDSNEYYLNSNLPDSNFSNLNLSMILYLNNSGQIIYGKEKRSPDDTTSDISDNTLSILSRLDLLKNIDEDFRLKGIIMLPEGPMLIASHPVVKSDDSGSVKGNIVFGRYFDESIVDELSGSLNLNVSAETIDPGEFKQLNNSSQQTEMITKITPISSDIIIGSKIIPDLLSESAVRINVTTTRDIYKIGQTTIAYTVAAIAIIFFVILLLLWILTNKYVIRRISKLHKDVTAITNDKDLSMRVEMNGSNDEIFCLSANINNMLNITETLNNGIYKANEVLEQRSTELVKANKALLVEKEKIKHMAYHDSLTSLPNGVYFNDYLSRQIMSASRAGAPLAILFIDLDGFKMINDTLGHAAGDELLVSVSKRLNKVLRKSDFIARIGGDEFTILINNVADVREIETIAARTLKKLTDPFNISGQECFISASIGISLYPTDGNNAEELTKNADLAMYKAKDSGKNRYCFCNQEMKNQIVENMILSNQLWRSLERNEFELFYQPQVNCYTTQIIGMEALIRWNHPDRGLVLPGKFITLAEQTGAINAIGEWVLKEACKQCKLWQDEYLPNLRMAVNLSVKQLQNTDIVHQVKSILEETGMDPTKLELEVTESVFIKEVEFVINILNKLKSLGVEIAIDDFGTEYASMNYLKHMPVNRIKIAMPFIQGLDISEKDQAITKAIIILAKSMGMAVIAEGVETKTQHDFLMQKLCDETQGFYFYKPMPAQEVEKILKRQYNENEADGLI